MILEAGLRISWIQNRFELENIGVGGETFISIFFFELFIYQYATIQSRRDENNKEMGFMRAALDIFYHL